MIRHLVILLGLIAAATLASAEGTVISVFEVQNNTGATLRITSLREEHGESAPEIDVAPGERRVLRLPVGTWQITATPYRARGVDPVTRRFLLPDAGPYGIAFASGDFGVARLEDGPWSSLPEGEDTAEAVGMPPAARRGVETEYPARRTGCEVRTPPAVNAYYAFIDAQASCVSPWSNSGFHEGRRVCRICPGGTEWVGQLNCCELR